MTTPRARTHIAAYALLFIAGYAGAHRFYLHRRKSAWLMMSMLVLGVAWLLFGVGLFILAGLVGWMVLDLFLIPGMVGQANRDLMDET